MKTTSLFCVLMVTIGCATSSTPYVTGPGSQQVHGNAVLHEGPEIEAILIHPSGKRTIGGEWLVLAAELSAAQGGEPIVVTRDNISLRAPDGRRLPLVSQDEFRGSFPRLQIPVQRSLEYLPLLDRYKPNKSGVCDTWFYAAPPATIFFEEIAIGSTQICSGPLVVRVPGGVQPGRWRLLIELQESRADIPFELALEDSTR
jgi:hypothetical protein